MAAFDPATIRLLRELLRDTNAQHKRDLGRRSKLPANSKSKMAQGLDDRIGQAVRVARDLDRLIPFMEALNREQPDAVPAERSRAEWAVLADEYFTTRLAADRGGAR